MRDLRNSGDFLQEELKCQEVGLNIPSKKGSPGEARREPPKTNMFEQKAKFPALHQALPSLCLKFSPGCRAMQVVTVLKVSCSLVGHKVWQLAEAGFLLHAGPSSERLFRHPNPSCGDVHPNKWHHTIPSDSGARRVITSLKSLQDPHRATTSGRGDLI